MKIFLTKELLDSFSRSSFRSLVKIIKTEKNSTLISIKGKIFKIPFLLKNGTRYNAVIKNNEIEIIEQQNKDKTINNKNTTFSNTVRKNLKKMDSFFFFDRKSFEIIENEIKNYPFFDLFSKIIDNEKEKSQKKYFRLKKQETSDHIFVFNLPFYNELARVFIRVGKSDVYLNIFSNKIEGLKKDDFVSRIKESISDKNRNIIIKISEQKEDFYNSIMVQLNKNNVDIEV